MSGPECSYTVIFDRNEDGSYTVTVPALPGLVTEGRTLNEARAMAREAVRCYLEGCAKCGDPLPVEREVIRETLSVPRPPDPIS